MTKYVYGQPAGHCHRGLQFWIVFFGLLAVFGVILAFYCSRPLDCSIIYESGGAKYCAVVIGGRESL